MPERDPVQFSQEVFATGETIIPVVIADTPAIDSFGRQRIASESTLFDSSFEYDEQPLLWQTQTTGNGSISHDSIRRCVIMSVTSSTDLVVRQTYAYHPYQKGESQRILATFVLGTAQDNTRRRVGYFDGNDGVFLEQDEFGLWFVLRSSTSGSVVDTRFKQTDWNVDTLDGNGPSKIILDASRRQILDIDIDWLGVGRIRFGFNINGKTYYGHYINNANSGDAAPYMRSGTLPLRYEIENQGGGSAADLIQICNTVISEGNFERSRGVPFSANNGTAAVAVTSRRPILTIRPKTTFNGIVNRGEIVPRNLRVYTMDNAALIELVYGGQLFNGTSFASAAPQSIVEYDTGSAIISGGYVVQSMYIEAAGLGVNIQGELFSPILSRLPLALSINGDNPLSLSIVGTAMAGTANVATAINWKENR